MAASPKFLIRKEFSRFAQGWIVINVTNAYDKCNTHDIWQMRNGRFLILSSEYHANFKFNYWRFMAGTV